MERSQLCISKRSVKQFLCAISILLLTKGSEISAEIPFAVGMKLYVVESVYVYA